MDPISSLRPAPVPGMLPLASVGDAAPVIPAAELRSLTESGLTPASTAPVSFGGLLGEMVQEVNARQAAAGQAVAGVLSGQQVSLHQAMIAMEEASVSFQLMVEVRNKLLESYQELMRMQV